MTVTGIIAEFNPFHNGHKYLLEQASGLKIIAMSGNFVQRGEPAIVDKWTRAQMALEAGADLVLELPLLVSVQAADFFAKGAVDILERLGIEQLTFGTEEVLDYESISRVYGQKAEQMEAYLSSLPDSLSYPQKTGNVAGVCRAQFLRLYAQSYLGLGLCQGCDGKGYKAVPDSTSGRWLSFLIS